MAHIETIRGDYKKRTVGRLDQRQKCVGSAATVGSVMKIDEKRCSDVKRLDRFFGDVFQVLPEFFRLIFSKDQRRIVGGAYEVNLDGHFVLPRLNLTIGDAVEIQSLLPNPYIMHEVPPVLSYKHRL